MALFNRNVNFSQSDYHTPNPSQNIKTVKITIVALVAIASFSLGFIYKYDSGTKLLDMQYQEEKAKFARQLRNNISRLKGELSEVQQKVPFIGVSKIYNAEVKYVTQPLEISESNTDLLVDNSLDTSNTVDSTNTTNNASDTNTSKTQVRKLSLVEQLNQAVLDTGNQNFFAKKHDPNEPVPEALPLVDLPVDIQRKIPKFTYNAHNYSSDPSRRSITINGKIIKEGGSYLNLKVMEIKQQYVIMRIDGQSFSVRSLEDNR